MARYAPGSFPARRGLSWLLPPALGERRVIRSPRRRGRAASLKRQAKSRGRNEGSSRIARCRIELYIWLKHARAWDKVCFQTDAVGVLEQHRIVTRRPCSLLRAVDYDGPNLSK